MKGSHISELFEAGLSLAIICKGVSPAFPLMVKSVSMLVQECSGGTFFSEIEKRPSSLICLVLSNPFL